MQNLFPFKDLVGIPLRSSLVYEFNCCDCNATYIGATTRHLRTRVSEHLGVSHRTGIQITNPSFSAIRNHCNTHNHHFDENNFKIITSCNSSNLHITESILIKEKSPSLNTGTSVELKTF